MQKPSFSIIIPTLNEEVALPVLLRNLVSQTFKNFEVIIVDGKSTDKTAKKALGFAGKLAVSFIVSNKRNVSCQRNLGVASAKANYLIFLDADTKIPKNFLKLIKSTVSDQKPDLLTTWIKTDEQGIKPIETGSNLIFEISKSIGSPALYGSMMVVKKSSFLKAGGFDESLKFKEDTKLAQKMYKMGFKYQIARNTFYEWSLRRFKKFGTLKTLQQHLLLNLNKILDYPMGGQIFASKKQKDKFDKFVDNLIEKFRLK